MTKTQKNPQGKRYNTGPTVAVTSGDLAGAWNDGVFVGDDELVEFAQIAATTDVEIKLFGVTFTCGSDTPEGALASLAARMPGRTIITEAPNEILERIATENGATDYEPPTTEDDYDLLDEDSDRENDEQAG